MNKWISKWWKSYKYRFVPWIALNVKRHESSPLAAPLVQSSAQKDENAAENSVKWAKDKPVQNVPVHHLRKSEEKLITDDQLTRILIDYFAKCLPQNDWNEEMDFSKMSAHNKNVMKDHFGFIVERKKSQVSADAGTGVFVSDGVAKAGSIVALYCGTLYMPSEPLFFPSLGNKYIFRCSDGIHIDGNDKWISKSIYKSCSARDRFDWDTPACDTSWLTPTPINPLNIGQFVNNRSHSQLNNVIYQECSLTWDISSSAIRLSNVSLRSGEVGDDKFIFGGAHSASTFNSRCTRLLFPSHLAGFLPNVWLDPTHSREWRGIRLVPLVALRDIGPGEEVLSSYFTVVHPDSAPLTAKKNTRQIT
ncbi:SET domain-containing protein 9 [Folsomia candida]|uniref:SET domain-containing protein 9 n=1 Tax=Folsomia candida TaxID=158441 RepID=UPI000B8F62DC|nr:SET domain-containing protein 9 [Folsomia candida]XP_021954632.1 SET domain-containing protein 9 [Folsomia candida]XP_035709128.1 SET domain-containing protein 9 [Folsomia candida]XP_035709129.1 SET domain-containing protein 9 [Folsomia candida]